MDSKANKRQNRTGERDAISKAGKLHLVHWIVISFSFAS